VTPRLGGLTLALRILLGVYIAFGLFAVAVIFIDPSDDPLAAVFLIIAAFPWTWLLSDRLGERPFWFNLVFLSAGVVVNAVFLFRLGNLSRRRALKRENRR
jgi:hypothetical protein